MNQLKKKKPAWKVAQDIRDMSAASKRRQAGENVTSKEVKKERKNSADYPGGMGRNVDEKTGNYSLPKKAEPAKPAQPASPPSPNGKKKRSLQEEIKARRFNR